MLTWKKTNESFHIFTCTANKARREITKRVLSRLSHEIQGQGQAGNPKATVIVLKMPSGDAMNTKEIVYLLRKEPFFIFHLTLSLSDAPNKIQ